ncbi:hypothetical protein NDU88_006320 [Pleurodeles waltl]|uniref:Uncharacterized protein n=1 Tax=Pleurodeles waltl TaxID=8319 RepID=A0AAV7WC69_PLEWA|nr:hypothetical protein NDU88_006320 [Pleurodeles waltl]
MLPGTRCQNGKETQGTENRQRIPAAEKRDVEARHYSNEKDRTLCARRDLYRVKRKAERVSAPTAFINLKNSILPFLFQLIIRFQQPMICVLFAKPLVFLNSAYKRIMKA